VEDPFEIEDSSDGVSRSAIFFLTGDRLWAGRPPGSAERMVLYRAAFTPDPLCPVSSNISSLILCFMARML
jgi:hypothetical protein